MGERTGDSVGIEGFQPEFRGGGGTYLSSKICTNRGPTFYKKKKKRKRKRVGGKLGSLKQGGIWGGGGTTRDDHLGGHGGRKGGTC